MVASNWTKFDWSQIITVLTFPWHTFTFSFLIEWQMWWQVSIKMRGKCPIKVGGKWPEKRATIVLKKRMGNPKKVLHNQQCIVGKSSGTWISRKTLKFELLCKFHFILSRRNIDPPLLQYSEILTCVCNILQQQKHIFFILDCRLQYSGILTLRFSRNPSPSPFG